MDSTLSHRLVMLREHCAGKRGQRVFARNVGIKQQSISNYERGSVPSAHVLAKIAMTTGCSAEWLLTGRGRMFPEGVDAPTMGDDDGGIDFLDDTGEPMTADSLAALLGTDLDEAEKWAKSLRADLPAGNAAVAVRTPEGETVLLQRRRASDESLVEKVVAQVSDRELTIQVPAALLDGRAVRIMPLEG